MKKIGNNIGLLKGVIALSQSTFHIPIRVIYFMEKGISLGQVAMLFTTFLISQLVFEVVAGVLGDRYGQRLTIILGGLCSIFALLGFVFFDSFMGLAVAMAVSGLGASLKSGSDSSLLYETLTHIGEGETFKKIYGSFTGYMFWGRAAGALIGGYLYTVTPELPFFFDIGLQITYMLLGFFLTDTFVQRVETGFIETIQGFKLSYKEAFTRKSFAKIFVFSALIGCIARVTLSQYVQPYLEFQSVDIVRFGIIFAVYNVISGIGALFADRFGTLFSIDKYLILHAAVFGIFLSFLETTHIVWLSLLMLAVLFFLMGLYTPTVGTYVNKNVQSHNRTTMLSINSQLYTIGAAIVLFFTGLASDVGGVTSALYLLSTLSFVFLVAYVLVVRKIETD